MFGLALALLGTLFGLPEMRGRLGVNLAQQGDLFLLLYSGILVANLAAGPTIDHFGHRPVLLIASALVTLALAGFAVATGFAAAAVAAILLGAGGGGLNTAATALVSDLFESERGSMLSYLGIFFGVGALFIPLLAASLAARFTVMELLLFAAGLAGACLMTFAALRFPAAQARGSVSLFQTLRVARNPGVLLFGFILFFQSGTEGAVAGWTSSYLGTLGASPQTATWILSGYWAAMMAGRALTGLVLRKVSKEQVLLASVIGALAGCVVLFAATSVFVLGICAAFLGLFFASVFPATLAMAGDRYPQSAGSVYALLFSVAVFGGMSFPWAIGHIGQSFGVRAGLVLPIFGMGMILVLLLSIIRRDQQWG
jgi:fucose permease